MTSRSTLSRRLRAGLRVAAALAVVTTASLTPASVAAATPAPSGQAGSATSPSAAPSSSAIGVPASQNATFGIQSVTGGRTDSRTAFTYQTGPGGAYQDSFAVVNYGAQPVRLQVYVADLTNNSDGSLAVGGATDAKDGAASWIHLPQGLSAVNVPARSSRSGPGLVRVPFAWAVPASAAAGDHTAAIVASLSVQSTGRNGQPVRLDQRVASRVFFRVKGTITAKLSVTDLTVVYSGTWNPAGSGTARVTYTLTNTGNVRLGAKQRLTSSAWLGAGGTPDAIADQPLLLPGGSVHLTATVHNVFSGVRLTEKLHVDPVRAADDVNVEPKAVEVETTGWAMPWALIALVVLIVLAVVAAVLYRRRRRARRPASGRHSRRSVPALN